MLDRASSSINWCKLLSSLISLMDAVGQTSMLGHLPHINESCNHIYTLHNMKLFKNMASHFARKISCADSLNNWKLSQAGIAVEERICASNII